MTLPVYEIDFGQYRRHGCICVVGNVPEELISFHKEGSALKHMPKFNIEDVVQFNERLGDGIHDSVPIEAGTVGVVEERTIRDDGSFAYTIDFSRDGREFSVTAKNIPESILNYF